MIVGADGGNSIVRQCAGIDPPERALGIMIKSKKKFEGPIKVFMNKRF